MRWFKAAIVCSCVAIPTPTQGGEELGLKMKPINTGHGSSSGLRTLSASGGSSNDLRRLNENI